MTASIHEILNGLVDVWPVDGEAGSCLGTGYTLVGFVEPA